MILKVVEFLLTRAMLAAAAAAVSGVTADAVESLSFEYESTCLVSRTVCDMVLLHVIPVHIFIHMHIKH